MKTTLLAIVIGISAAASALGDTILMDPTTNDGSFESRYTGSTMTDTTTTGLGSWETITRTGASQVSGVFSRPNANSTFRFDTISASHISNPNMGGVAAFAQEDQTITYSSIDLLGTNGYSIQTGDRISYSVDLNAQVAIAGVTSTTSSVNLGLDFGNGLVGSSLLVADDTDGSANGGTPYSRGFHQTLSLTYIVTASDVAGGSLRVVTGLDTLGASGTPAYLDNVIISAAAVPEPSSIALMGLLGLGLVTRRRRSN